MKGKFVELFEFVLLLVLQKHIMQPLALRDILNPYLAREHLGVAWVGDVLSSLADLLLVAFYVLGSLEDLEV